MFELKRRKERFGRMQNKNYLGWKVVVYYRATYKKIPYILFFYKQPTILIEPHLLLDFYQKNLNLKTLRIMRSLSQKSNLPGFLLIFQKVTFRARKENFHPERISYISGNGNPETTLYIPGNGNPKKLLIFQQGTSKA